MSDYKMIITSECEECRYGLIDDSNKARVMVQCLYRDKKYFYGQCIPCDDKKNKNKGV